MGHWENLDAFRARTRGFMSDSLPKDGQFFVSEGALKKALPEGFLTYYYGNTVIFEMDDSDKAWLAEIQKKLYDACGWCFAEPLEKDSFHITLHDLLSSSDANEVLPRTREMAPRVMGKLEQIRAEYPAEVYLRPVFLFNMMNTSVVLGFEPASDEDSEILMRLYDEFQTEAFVPLNYPLTPHVTLAYYRRNCERELKQPDLELPEDFRKAWYAMEDNERVRSIRQIPYDHYMIDALQRVFSEVNRTISRRTVKLKLSDLHHRYFLDMNGYYENIWPLPLWVPCQLPEETQ